MPLTRSRSIVSTLLKPARANPLKSMHPRISEPSDIGSISMQKVEPGPFAFVFTSPRPGDDREELTLDEAFLEALQVADPMRKSAMRIYRGGLLLASSARKPQAITVEKPVSPLGRSSIRASQAYTQVTDKTLYGVRVGDFVETSLERWNTFHKESLWDSLANRATDVTFVSELRPEVVLAIDSHLRSYSRYLGVFSPDLGNPLHRELLVDALFKDAFIQNGTVFGCRDFSGELHVSFYGVEQFSGRKMVPLSVDEFERRAPTFNPNVPLSPRGLITRQRLERLNKLDVHQRIMQEVSYGPAASKLPFDWDLSQLPDSPDEIFVHARKLTNYLLDTDGKEPSKAKFFKDVLQIGADDWKFMLAQLVDGLAALELENVRIEDEYGIRFDARFPLTGTNGATATILTAWIVRQGERASLTTAHPLKKDPALEKSAQRPLVVLGLPPGNEKWAAVHALADDHASAAMQECVPRPMVVRGGVIMGGTIGTAYVVVRDGRSGFARWARTNGVGHTHHPRGIAIEAERIGQSSESATRYANAYANVLRRNEIECKVETYLD